MKDSYTSVVQAIGDFEHVGNLVNPAWAHWLKVFNGGKTSNVIPIAINILGDIVYWYRPTEIRNEKTGAITGYRDKFWDDKLQRSYAAIASQWAITKSQAKSAVKLLEDAGVINVEFRNVVVKGQSLSNVMYLEPYPEVVKLWRSNPFDENGDRNEELVSEYFSLCAKLPIPMRQKIHRSEEFSAQVCPKSPRRIQRVLKDSSNNSSESSKYVKAPGRADIGESNFEPILAKEEQTTSGFASPGNQIHSCGGGETHETQIDTTPYSTIWNPKTEPFHQDEDGWAVLPQFPKYKLANFMATRAMQLELLHELDNDFEAEWSVADSQLWISTTHAGTGLEDDILGTVETAGSNWVEYDDEEENYCHPGAASIRVLRNWGHSQDKLGQSWFNERLKELWDDSVRFCKKHGDNAKPLLKSRPIWESLHIEIDLE